MFRSSDSNSSGHVGALPVNHRDTDTEVLIPLNERLSRNHCFYYGTQSCTSLNSFELNQSFPKINVTSARDERRKRGILNVVTPLRHRHNNSRSGGGQQQRQRDAQTMEKIKLDGFNGLRFTPYRKKGCFTPNSGSPYSCSLFNTKCGINPNKAVFTIDAKTSAILIVNKNASTLLGYSSRELCDSSIKFSNLLACKNKVHVSALAENQFNEDGSLIMLSGKVVEMIHKNGQKIPVSLWIRHIDSHDASRCLAVAEAVERKIGQLVITPTGTVTSGDNEALMLFQLEALEKFIGLDITVLIPSIQLPDVADNLTDCIPKHIRKQRATGKTQDGVSFPLCLMVTKHESGSSNNSGGVDGAEERREGHDSRDERAAAKEEQLPQHSDDTSSLYDITIWVYSNLSGLVVIDDNSIIESCNHHFSTLMFGYPQSKIIGQNIFKLIPNFGQEFEYIDARTQMSPSVENEESETETDHILMNDPFSMSTCLVPPSPPVPPASSLVSLVNATKSSRETFKICLDFTSSSHSSLRSDIDKGDSSETERNAAATHYSTDDDTNELLTPVNEDPVTATDQLTSSNSINVSSAPIISNIDMTPKSINSNQHSNSNISSSSNNNSSNKATEMQATKLAAAPATSTPDARKRSSIGPSLDTNYLRYQSPQSQSSVIQQFNYNYVDGKYKGEAVHSDGNIIDIVYTINRHNLIASNTTIYLIWISRDRGAESVNDEDEEGDEEKQFNLTLTLNSFTSTIDNSVGGGGGGGGGGMKNTTASSVCLSNATSSMMTSATAGTNTLANITSQASRPNSLSIISQCEEEQISGEYAKNYTTLKQIGKGAYGFVKMAYRTSDKLLVISKFILKEKLCSNFMITTDDKKEIPMEIYLLMRVKHPNIVSVLDVYENEKFFQLIMEKHGSGMDLFEFIDRRPLMDEKLGCFIFRQIANAVDYLHSLNILHRDIKDENIIIDHHFQIKLIDFGSATFMQEGKMFSTFYGTTEYCSPEVLAGNKYRGPELEVWSLGVTLYVLMFFENPFLDMEDTLRAELLFPQDVSVGLENLLLRMLEKDPKTRMTMKELLVNEWIAQEIVNNFNFASIVPCTESESHPDVYFDSGLAAAYSSATALSTSHDSLSLADDSIVDACDETSDLKCDIEADQPIMVNINQNLNDLSLNKDDLVISASNGNRTPSNRSKTGNQNKMDVSDAQQQQPPSSQFQQCNTLTPYLTLNTPSLQSTISPTNPLTTSKSENNIFDKNMSMNASQFNVVSLSDLSDDAPYTCADSNGGGGLHYMNDLSRTQVLNRLSDERIDADENPTEAMCEENEEYLWESHYYSREDAFEDN